MNLVVGGVTLKYGGKRKKKAIGKGDENLREAFKSAELLACRLGLVLMRKSTDLTFGLLAREWYELNAGRWRPRTKERYECIIREHLQSLEKLPLEKVDKAQVKRLLADLLQIMSPKTLEVTHAVNSGIFTEANELGMPMSTQSMVYSSESCLPRENESLTNRSSQPSRPGELPGSGLGQPPRALPIGLGGHGYGWSALRRSPGNEYGKSGTVNIM